MAKCLKCGDWVSGSAVCGSCGTATVHDEGMTERRLRPGDLTPVAPGQVLEGKWRLESNLGRGGMGTVMLAYDLTLDRKVAIKLLNDELCHLPHAVARFEREARLTAQLDHPNIVSVHAVGRVGARPFIVMKYLSGMPLSHYLRSTPIPLADAEVLSIAKQVGAGLEFLHAKGFIHRDIKPANIFISPEGRATLLDFGILIAPAEQPLTRTGITIGTPDYMAPEQLLRGGTVDQRTDLFAFGMVLFELMTGVMPPPQDPRSRDSTAAKALAEQASWLAPSRKAFLLKALALAPDDRFQNAAELLVQLEQTLAPASAKTRTPLPPRRRRRWPVYALAGLAVTTAAALGAAVLVQRRTPEERSEQAVAPTPSAVVEDPPPARLEVPENAPEEPPARPVRSPENAPEEPPARPVRLKKNLRISRSRGGAAPGPRTSAPTSKPAAEPAAPGQLRVVTIADGQPTWATLSVGNLRYGTPVSFDLAAGKHRLRIERSGFKPVEREVVIRPGELSVVRVELSP